MACQLYFIVLTVRTSDIRNHDRLQPVWGSLRLAPTMSRFNQLLAIEKVQSHTISSSNQHDYMDTNLSLIFSKFY